MAVTMKKSLVVMLWEETSASKNPLQCHRKWCNIQQGTFFGDFSSSFFERRGIILRTLIQSSCGNSLLPSTTGYIRLHYSFPATPTLCRPIQHRSTLSLRSRRHRDAPSTRFEQASFLSPAFWLPGLFGRKHFLFARITIPSPSTHHPTDMPGIESNLRSFWHQNTKLWSREQ